MLGGLRPRGEQLVELAAGPVLRAGDRLVEHLHQLVQDLDGALGHGREQHRELLVVVAARQGLVSRAPPDPGEPAAQGVRQRREIQPVGVQAAQESQLVQFAPDRHRRGRNGAAVQPRQPGDVHAVLDRQQPVQLDPALLGQQVLHPQVDLADRVLSECGDAFHQRDHPRPDDLRGLQVLAAQPEQHARRVVLDRSREQELLESFHSAGPAVRQPSRAAIVRRCSVRVCFRAPYPARSAIGIPSCTATRFAAAAGAAATSSGTKPSHGKVHSWIAIPSRFPVPRAELSSQDRSSEPSVKYRISSSRPNSSGQDRSRLISASEKNRVDTQTPTARPSDH